MGAHFVAWAGSYANHPELADHVVKVVRRQGWNMDAHARRIVLDVIGDDVQEIDRGFHRAVAWLRLVLLTDPGGGQLDSRALDLLDRLAASGDEAALGLQRDLEI